MSPFKRPVGSAEEIAKKTQTPRVVTDRKRSRNPVTDEKPVEIENRTTIPSQPTVTDTTNTAEETKGANTESDSKESDTITTSANTMNVQKETQPQQQAEVTRNEPINEPAKEEIPLIKPKEGQTKLSGFTDERLLAFMKFYGVQHKKHAVAVLLDIAEGELPPLNDTQKVGYDSLMNSIKDIYAANHWSTDK